MNVLFAATGKPYFEEGITAIRSVREQHPTAAIQVFCDRVYHPIEGVEFIVLEKPDHSFRDKIQAILQTSFDRFLYLDTDVFVGESIEGAYRLLDRFDFAAAMCEIRVTPKMAKYNNADFLYPEIPDAFPEYNSGVMAIRKSPEMIAALRAWNDIHEAETLRWGTTLPDQPTLRKALWEGQVRLHGLPYEYNLRLPYFGYVEADVRVLHGRRSYSGHKALLEKSRPNGPRVYLPRIGFVRQSSWPFHIALTARNQLRKLNPLGKRRTGDPT